MLYETIFREWNGKFAVNIGLIIIISVLFLISTIYNLRFLRYKSFEDLELVESVQLAMIICH